MYPKTNELHKLIHKHVCLEIQERVMFYLSSRFQDKVLYFTLLELETKKNMSVTLNKWELKFGRS